VAPLTEFQIDLRLKRFPGVGESAALVALQDLRITAHHGEFVCILGPSGCGKTTLLNIVAGLDSDYEGRLSLPAVAGQGEPRIGYVFQNPRLLPWRTAIENIELVLAPEAIGSDSVDHLIATAGLDDFRRTYPERLSLGLSRRVALVRAFAIEPDLLLMDEPFVSLDEPTAQRLRFLLLDIWRERPTTVLFVTHNLREAILLADRLILLSAAPGRVLADLRIDVPREARREPDALEACRAKLVRDNPALFREL
jgi:NitT/TauT family transport system ATP-binding protein